ncbi:proteasome inhibitor pi31 subunit [Anaeramoeba ignava]|uniref:Proteasome inhibitor pi31 subunit n=1 Tax=Anaeramoeba ignava TaxID=1746090 RepID=A0A9Q0LJF0_ANAIG|nr:proteasome inhibitor pi31 subunit [Anaeramoeba ignava]|eukprot:Anaeramoba_ignava/c21759_g2_i1.p1 GENE.c21759_g2_i1~~c21759_g2_i1.p1  ORF type:complete len:339 (-),score=115.01 c21759_g2_i1:97-1074(-)
MDFDSFIKQNKFQFEKQSISSDLLTLYIHFHIITQRQLLFIGLNSQKNEEISKSWKPNEKKRLLNYQCPITDKLITISIEQVGDYLHLGFKLGKEEEKPYQILMNNVVDISSLDKFFEQDSPQATQLLKKIDLLISILDLGLFDKESQFLIQLQKKNEMQKQIPNKTYDPTRKQQKEISQIENQVDRNSRLKDFVEKQDPNLNPDFDLDPLRIPNQRRTNRTRPPFSIGENDFPFGPDLGPDFGGNFGGNFIGPNHPSFFQPPKGTGRPNPQNDIDPFRIPPNSIPPKAKFDPFGPPELGFSKTGNPNPDHFKPPDDDPPPNMYW